MSFKQGRVPLNLGALIEILTFETIKLESQQPLSLNVATIIVVNGTPSFPTTSRGVGSPHNPIRRNSFDKKGTDEEKRGILC